MSSAGCARVGRRGESLLYFHSRTLITQKTLKGINLSTLGVSACSFNTACCLLITPVASLRLQTRVNSPRREAMKGATSDDSNPCCHLSLHSSAQPDRQKRADTSSHGIRRGNYPFVKLEKEFAEAASARTLTSEDMHSRECHGTSSPGLVSLIHSPQSNLQTVQRFVKDEKAKAEQGAQQRDQEIPNPRTRLEGSDGQNPALIHSAD